MTHLLNEVLSLIRLHQQLATHQLSSSVFDLEPRTVATTPEFNKWLSALKDRAKATADVIARRIKRVEDSGFFGDHRNNIRPGVNEMKVDVGPGYRLYYTEREHDGKPAVVFLVGGDKKTQDSDIVYADRLADTAESFFPAVSKKIEKKQFTDYNQSYELPRMFAALSDDDLLAAGVPAKRLKDVRDILAGDVDTLLAVVDLFSEETGQFLVEYAVKEGTPVSSSVRACCKLVELRAKCLLNW
jgi:putative addiction module killer protein